MESESRDTAERINFPLHGELALWQQEMKERGFFGLSPEAVRLAIKVLCNCVCSIKNDDVLQVPVNGFRRDLNKFSEMRGQIIAIIRVDKGYIIREVNEEVKICE